MARPRMHEPDHRPIALQFTVVASIEIKDDRVIAVVPQPDFAPFFLERAEEEGLTEANENGPDDAEPSSEVLTGRKRRASVWC